MGRPKKVKVEEVKTVEEPVVEVVEEFVNNTNVTTHEDRWGPETNTNVSSALPSLDD